MATGGAFKWVVDELLAPQEPAPDPIRVLLFSTAPELAEGQRIMLEDDGYTVTVAGDVNAALSVLGATPQDLLFIDAAHSGREGERVIEAIHHRPAAAPLAVLLLRPAPTRDAGGDPDTVGHNYELLEFAGC